MEEDIKVDLEREEMLKNGELSLIDAGWEALGNGDLELAHKAIMSVLESYNTGMRKTTDLWAIKYYIQIASPSAPTELETLVKAYLKKLGERVQAPQDKTSYFSKYELGLLDELFDKWKKLTNHKGQGASKLFIGWLQSNYNNLEERLEEK